MFVCICKNAQKDYLHFTSYLDLSLLLDIMLFHPEIELRGY